MRNPFIQYIFNLTSFLFQSSTEIIIITRIRNMEKSFYYLIFFVFSVFTVICYTNSQFFDPILDDKTYLDNMELEVQAEVEQTSAILLREAKSVEIATKEYIGSKLKDNVFKALRVLAEHELVKLEVEGSRRIPRQEEGEAGGAAETGGAAEGGDTGGAAASAGGGDEEAATTELTGLGTAVKINQNIFKFLGDTFKIIFQGLGGKTRRFPKKFVDEASLFMSEPFADQLLGLIGLMANESQRTASIQAKVGKVDELGVLNVLFHRGVDNSQPKNDNSIVQDALLESGNAMPDLTRFNVDGFTTSFRKSVDAMNDPAMLLDLYRGVRESYKFLDLMSTLNQRIRNAS